jgi:hypothetical protein
MCGKMCLCKINACPQFCANVKDVLNVVHIKWIMWNYNSNGYLILRC